MTMTPLATELIENFGRRDAMMITVFATAVFIIPAAFLIRRAPEALAEAPRPGSDVVPSPKPPTNIGTILRTLQFIVLAAVCFLCCGAHSGPIFHTVSYAMLCGASALAAASIYSVESLVYGGVMPSMPCWRATISAPRVRAR